MSSPNPLEARRIRTIARHLQELIGLSDDPTTTARMLECARELFDRADKLDTPLSRPLDPTLTNDDTKM